MPKNTSLVILGGALAMLGVATAAGWVAGSLATRDAAPAQIGSSGGGDAVLDTAELDRRLEALVERMRQVEDASYAGLDLRDEVEQLRADVDGLLGGTAAVAIAAAPDAPIATDDPDDRNLTQRERAEVLRKKAREMAERNAPHILRSLLASLVDTSDGADARRRTQVAVEAQQLAVRFVLDYQERDKLRAVLDETLAQQIRDVGPYLRGGLDRADYARVGEEMGKTWDARDARFKEIFDEDSWSTFEEEQKGYRAVMELAFQKLDDERKNR